jgi:aminopeptidase N
MPGTLATLSDERARVVVWNALQLAVEDAEVSPATAADVLVAALPTERASATLARVGRWALRRLCGTLLTGAERAETCARICGAALAVTRGADAGGGRQLAAFRIAVASATDDAALRDWLAGEGLPPGLDIDRELRWAVLLRLAELGNVAEEDIAHELSADRSSQGAVHAARCSAARPDPGAKHLAWETMMTDPDRPNYELYALADGFWHADQVELTDGYVERYFAEIPSTAELRSGWVVDELARRAYPWTAVRPETLDASERLVAMPDLHAGLRRSVVDAADDLRRAVTIRRAYRG